MFKLILVPALTSHLSWDFCKVLTQHFANYMNLDQCLALSEPQFLHLKAGE